MSGVPFSLNSLESLPDLWIGRGARRQSGSRLRLALLTGALVPRLDFDPGSFHFIAMLVDVIQGAVNLLDCEPPLAGQFRDRPTSPR